MDVGVHMVYRGSGTGLRIALMAFAAAVGCVMAAALLLMVLPQPHTHAHYLVAGTAPSIVGLLALMSRTQRDRARTRRLVVRRAPTNPPPAT